MFCKTLVQPLVHKIVKGTTRMPTYSSIKVFKCLPFTNFGNKVDYCSPN